MLGSWRRRWNAHLPGPGDLAIDDGTGRQLSRAIRLTAFDLHTEHMDTGHNHQRAGFTGTATLRLDPPPRPRHPA